MQVHDAITRISEIHDHLARSEVYRGYRSIPIALSGIVAMVGATIQPYFVGQPPIAEQAGMSYVVFWCTLAGLSLVVAAGGIVERYVRERRHARRQARKAIGQFLPCLAGGAIVTVTICTTSSEWIVLLPGMWSLLFALGTFASRPYLPRAIGWVGLFYLCAGGVLLGMSQSGTSLSPWAMGWTFGLGQLGSATVLYWKIERVDV